MVFRLDRSLFFLFLSFQQQLNGLRSKRPNASPSDVNAKMRLFAKKKSYVSFSPHSVALILQIFFVSFLLHVQSHSFQLRSPFLLRSCQSSTKIFRPVQMYQGRPTQDGEFLHGVNNSNYLKLDPFSTTLVNSDHAIQVKLNSISHSRSGSHFSLYIVALHALLQITSGVSGAREETEVREGAPQRTQQPPLLIMVIILHQHINKGTLRY